MSCLTSLQRQNLKERLKMSLDFNIEKTVRIDVKCHARLCVKNTYYYMNNEKNVEL